MCISDSYNIYFVHWVVDKISKLSIDVCVVACIDVLMMMTMTTRTKTTSKLLRKTLLCVYVDVLVFDDDSALYGFGCIE